MTESIDLKVVNSIQKGQLKDLRELLKLSMRSNDSFKYIHIPFIF